ncbi:MAG: hypothetical protein PHR24_00055 [Oscillospiraceae bacterium]|nr:hypothetical protein [Oscillospiraceae bacterium]
MIKSVVLGLVITVEDAAVEEGVPFVFPADVEVPPVVLDTACVAVELVPTDVELSEWDELLSPLSLTHEAEVNTIETVTRHSIIGFNAFE